MHPNADAEAYKEFTSMHAAGKCIMRQELCTVSTSVKTLYLPDRLSALPTNGHLSSNV
jgi:hypothetical protein